MLVTVSDRKLQVSDNGQPAAVSYYLADVMSANDYYPFGMMMPGRKYSSDGYRYGFNGKENDNDVKGAGNQQDYGMRVYDPRLGKFLSEDPLTQKYPELTPYQFASNNPIKMIDLDGLEGAEPKKPGGKEFETTEVTHTACASDNPGCDPDDPSTFIKTTYIWHEGGFKGSKPGWYTESDYFNSVLKPLGKAYNNFQDNSVKKDMELYVDFVFSRKGDYNYYGIIQSAAKYLKENPTYDSWARNIPIWGSYKQAELDFSVGKWGWGTFNTGLALSDMFLLKSAFQAPVKSFLAEGANGFKKYFGIGMSHNYGASVSRWKGLGLDMGGYKHHWLISQELMESYPILKPLGNQTWNLTRFSTQAAHMRWAHGQTYGGISYPFSGFLYPFTSTPNWFKLGLMPSIGGRFYQSEKRK